MKLRSDLPELPDRISRLPVDERGYPVPWFVAWVDGKPDFRVIGEGKREEAVGRKRCWVCGGTMGSFKAFLIGPMCAINRISSEPPSHRDCADFAARACPFLTRPRMRRRTAGMPENVQDADGIACDRNPGVALVWVTKRYGIRSDGNGGWLIQVGEPEETRWYAEGREATPAEVWTSVEEGLPFLEELAAKEGPKAQDALQRQMAQARAVFPAHP